MTIIFVCHGNICRSPIAEILLKELAANDDVKIYSRATSLEEIGNDIYPPMKRVLCAYSHEYKRHYATRITKEELNEADYVFYMDRNNLYYLERLLGPSKKYHLISEFDDNKEVEDPWYTDRFDYVYHQIKKYVESIYKKVITK